MKERNATRTSQKSKYVNDVKKGSKKLVKDDEKYVSTKKIQKRKNNSFKIVIAFLVIAIVVSLLVIMFANTVFELSNIEIKGTDKYTKDDILASSSLKIGENIFVQTLNKNRINVENFAYIKSFSYEYKLPDTLVINIVERTPIYIAYNKDVNKYYEIDEDGYILKETKAEKSSTEQVFVYGIIFSDDFVIGERINEIDLEKLQCFKNIQAEFRNSGINANITGVSFENSLTTITLNDKLNVIFADDKNLDYLMAFLKGIIENIGVDTVGTIDMTKTNPTFSIY